MGTPKFTDVKGAAELLGVSVFTVRQWSSMRKLPFYKVGRLTKYKMSDLEAFLESKRVEAKFME